MKERDWSCINCETDENTYPEVFDTIIIGAGPAGMTAAIYAARRKMKILLICGKVGGQMMWSSDIENWTGVAQATGPELTKQFFDHVRTVDNDNAHFDLWVRENERATCVDGTFETGFQIKTDTNQTFSAKTIICTTGKIPRTLEVPGEKIAMQGNGLSFCATCDAPLYKDKKMVVIGGGNSAMDVALQLDKFTDDITLLVYDDELIGEVCMREKIEKSPHIQVITNADTKEVLLDANDKVRAVSYKKDSAMHELLCEGIFEEIGQKPATKFLEKVVKLNEGREIITSSRCETQTKGIFAGGDCSNQVHKQVVVAAAEGAICALEAHELLLRS